MNEAPPVEEYSSTSSELREAYDSYVDEVRVRNSKVALVLVMVLMPAGFILDSAVYKKHVHDFLIVRFLASLLAALVFLGLRRPNLAKWQSRLLCMGWYLLPASSIAWMIAWTGGMTSYYYAGLNLVILAVSSVIQATVEESVIAVVLITLMYCAACFIPPAELSPWSPRDLVNNLYFISLTSIIVVTGNYFFNRLRFREFSLRHELAQNRRQLEESNDKLKELDQIKNRFFANISHELRTPLTLLLSPLESMMHGRGQQFDGQTRNLMSIMHGNGMRLLKLINDLLDLVRLESGRMEVKREPLEMNAFVRGLMGAAQQMADTKGLKLETHVQSDLGPLMVDSNKLEKTILNLVFNALKFTPKGGTVSLRVQRQGEQLVIEVEDTGVGISEKNLPHVFDRFWQADNSSKRKFQGVGIGLSLVKELTEVQGGSVSVKSQEGKGTTFTVNLPFIKAEGAPVPAKPNEITAPKAPEPVSVAPAPASAQSEEWLANLYRRAELFPSTNLGGESSQPAKVAENGNGQPRLLVADDEPDMLRFLKSQLEEHYQVIQAVDGQQAVEKATAQLPEIILLDMNMPEKDGLQVCRELRAQASTQEIPIIVLTARADEQTKLDALSAGANDFLCKPFSTSELHVRVKNLVDSHHFKQKLAKQNDALAKTINQLKETETILVQTEKMASLGRMSAGIMHEINNPLNYASTGLYTLRNKTRFLSPEQQTEYNEVLHEVEEGITRVKHIVTDLKSFTHPDTELVDVVQVAPILTSALRFLSSEWKEKLLVEQKIPETLVIHANRNKLLQVFVNILQNSLDAIRRKQFAAGEQPAICIEGREENGKTVLIFRDNGEGMDTKTVAKVFDPFFTTKDVGEGMGLGLTICYRIIKEYDGRVTVNSERGKYSEFRIEFPIGGPNGKPQVPQKDSHEQHA
ncbi:MAG TPA: ATP-binding protein [Verrucomicrobiae bacterium]|nr:ATP-binding protein [Verrucomicrobiae bacterium]